MLTSQTGRIVSRLCKGEPIKKGRMMLRPDVESSDTGLTWALNRVLVASLAFIGSIGLVAWSLPWMCLVYVPCLAVIVSTCQPKLQRRDSRC